jgi:superfamily II DNA or RNA helicase
MVSGELDVLFAVDIAKEGLDIPRLDRLFLVAGGRNEAELEQKVGRIQRACPGKLDAVVFDIVDERIGVLRAQYYARRKVYKSLGLRMEAVARSA